LAPPDNQLTLPPATPDEPSILDVSGRVAWSFLIWEHRQACTRNGRIGESDVTGRDLSHAPWRCEKSVPSQPPSFCRDHRINETGLYATNGVRRSPAEPGVAAEREERVGEEFQAICEAETPWLECRAPIPEAQTRARASPPPKGASAAGS